MSYIFLNLNVHIRYETGRDIFSLYYQAVVNCKSAEVLFYSESLSGD